MLEIDLIRHVKIEGKPALYGRTDVMPNMVENTRLLVRLVTQQQTSNAYQGIVCSPLKRCHTLAKEFSANCNLPLAVFHDLKEMNFGSFDGVAFDELYFNETLEKTEGQVGVNTEQYDEIETELRWSQLEAFLQTPADIVLPNAEALSDFYQRVKKAWYKLIAQQVMVLSQQSELQAPRRILVVVHGGVIRMILAHILQLDWQQASWHQKLKINHGSISRVVISKPYQNDELHQQVTSIAMPFLEEL
jgi:alpha-ribazole phosphatase/probable phosphoglycerate mutase